MVMAFTLTTKVLASKSPIAKSDEPNPKYFPSSLCPYISPRMKTIEYSLPDIEACQTSITNFSCFLDSPALSIPFTNKALTLKILRLSGSWRRRVYYGVKNFAVGWVISGRDISSQL